MNLLFPVETLNREIDFRITLAAKLAEKDRSIFVGQYQFLQRLIPHFKNGIYAGKNIFAKRSDVDSYQGYYRLKKKGFDIVYLHEEGAVFSGTEKDWQDKLSSQYNIDVFDENDRVCVWGDFQGDYDRGRIKNKNVPVVTTGHPRFELYKKYRFLYDEDVRKIKERFGEYVLINGNYGRANHGGGLSYFFSDKGNYIVNDPVKRLQKIDYYVGSAIQLSKMVELVHHMAVRYPHINFVYRPHPVENHSYYHTVFKGVPNIHTVYEGSVGPWILGSSAILHDGCTTAIEAQLSGIPVINYKPIYAESNSNYLPNQMGRRAQTIDEVAALLEEAFRDKAAFSAGFVLPEKAVRLMENFRSDAFDRLTDVIEERVAHSTKTDFSVPGNNVIRKAFLRREAKLQGSKFYNKMLGRKEGSFRLAEQKFQGFDKVYIQDKIAMLEKVLQKKIHVQFYNKYLIRIGLK
ncbi:hypothetical protein KK062_15180 [Fulvivirgaceae bacterium PWU5]|uniref:Surface carbohydrate biosynthesis protein n=1 Tax=Dawidia cretensis TaxID=2782350 RepID=A0AAP2E045_9BACT|nr:surface carbohydrate biosynthesis protein [Dawidia cretensis]MBT1709584.1 hypothetical protein [Dawidia cretensis]